MGVSGSDAIHSLNDVLQEIVPENKSGEK